MENAALKFQTHLFPILMPPESGDTSDFSVSLRAGFPANVSEALIYFTYSYPGQCY